MVVEVHIAVVDPSPSGPRPAAGHRGPRLQHQGQRSTANRPDGPIPAAHDQFHVGGALQCAAAGIPVLIEKPVGESVEAAANRGAATPMRCGWDGLAPRKLVDAVAEAARTGWPAALAGDAVR